MDALPFYEIHKICRICLKTDLLVSIFSPTTFLMRRPIEMIEKLQIFKLQPDDNLPTLLCQSCLYRLLDAYNLQQLAEASERHLRDYLGSSNASKSVSFAPYINAINSQESTSFSTTTSTVPDVTKDVDATAAIYANICDMFEHNGQSIDIEVEADDVLEEIDVSSLTRSEANDNDTLSEVFVGGDITGYDTPPHFMENEQSGVQAINMPVDEADKSDIVTARGKRNGKILKTPEKCFDCGKIFKYSGYLEIHKRTHTGHKPFKCKLCARRFTQSSNLLLHQRTHTGERRYQCEICSNLFTTSSNLKAHKLTHIEVREFHCERCGLSFKTSRELRRHEPIHKKTKDIICQICQKAFTKSSYLSAHMQIHAGIKRHKCTECGKFFANKSNLICHQRTHTGEKPFECCLCSWKFNQSSALVRHMKKHDKSDSKLTKRQARRHQQREDQQRQLQVQQQQQHHTEAEIHNPQPQTNDGLYLQNADLVESHNQNQLINEHLTQPNSNYSNLITLQPYPATNTNTLPLHFNHQLNHNLHADEQPYPYQVYDTGILDFSTHQQNQTQNLYYPR